MVEVILSLRDVRYESKKVLNYYKAKTEQFKKMVCLSHLK